MKRAKNKIIISLLAVAMAFSLSSCTNQEDIDNAVNPVTEQITQIDGYIDTLEGKVAALETELLTVNTMLESLEESRATKTALAETKTALENEIAAIKVDIQALKDKDSAFAGELSALDGRLTTLATSIETLNTAVTALQTQVEENTNKIEELEIRINCLEGKHVTETFYYTYTWSETAPTSIKNSPCIHCEKIIEETVSPGVWTVGDKVTYIAKDGNSYVSTVGEVTDGKAVLVSDNDYSKKVKSEESALLALLEPVGARFPRTSETIYTTIIEPWLMEAIEWDERKNGGLAQSFGYVEKYSANRYLYKAKISDGNFYISNGVIGLGGVQAATWIYRYIWDVEFTTAE